MNQLRNIILLSLIIGSLYACKEQVKSESPATKISDARLLYEKNLATLQKGIAAIEQENIDKWMETVSDTTIWNSAVYGSSPAGKQEWKQALLHNFSDWDSIKLNFPDFLPGIDSATHEFDGSVRYYGIWTGIHKSGVRTSVNMYATYDFNAENKIVNASEFFDAGGLLNAIQSKQKKKD